MAISRPRLGLITSLLVLASPASALAAAPGDWSIAIERVFGISRSTLDTSPGGSVTTTQVSLLGKTGGATGYSVPRVAFDYITSSNLSIGGAIGYQSTSVEDDDIDSWLFAPRLGYFARLGPGFGLWPRAGITHFVFDTSGTDASATALTLELPLEFLVAGGVAFQVLPHVDVGLTGSAGDADYTLTELGLQFGLGVFF